MEIKKELTEVKKEVKKETEDEAVKSVLTSINKKIETEIEKVKSDLDAKVSDWQSKQAKTKKVAGLMDLVNNEELVSFSKNLKKDKSTISLEIKDFDFRAKSTAGDMSVSGNYSGTIALSELDPVVSRDPQRKPFIEELVRVGTINAPIDVWIETTDETGEPAPVAELALIPQKDYDFVERTRAVKKIAVYAKYSAEMAEDLPNLIGEIRNFLIADLRRVVDTQILSGNGSGENLTGILENAVAFSAGSLAGTVDDANNFDALRAGVNQVQIALHEPNYIVLHPTDIASMEMTKDSNGQYVMPPFISAGGAVVSGLRIIANTGITAGNFLIGDFTKSSVKYRKGLTVELTNTDQDDFIRDRFTVRAIVRLVHRVRVNDFEAFVYGNFTTAKSALDSGS